MKTRHERRVRKAAILGAASALAVSAVTDAFAAVTDEIVVTARKREESLQDIPISGVVLGKEFIDDFALDGARDFIRFIPGAFIATNGGPEFRDDIVIRGSGAEAVESTASATSINRNGLFIGNGTFFGRTFTRFDLFDVERFEVFRGPQGALFGRNAVGGAVNVVTAKPKFEHEGSVKLRYEVEQETKTIEVIENFPVNDKVAVRLGALWDKREGGFIVADDPLSPLDGKNFDAAFYGGVRAQLRVQPTDTIDINLTAEFSENESASFANILAKPPGIVNGLAIGRDVDVGKKGRRRFSREDFQTDTETANIFLEADWDTGIGVWNATFHFQNRNANAHDDFDAFRAITPVYPAMFDIPANANREDLFTKYSGELYLQSNESTPDYLRWLVGADFQIHEDHFEQFAPFFISSQGDILAYDLMGMQLTMGVGYRGDKLDFYRNLTRRLKSYSGFASVEYDVNDEVTASVEGRVTHNKLDGIFQSLNTVVVTEFSGGLFGMTPIPPPGCVTGLGCFGTPVQVITIDVSGADGGIRKPTSEETKFTPVGSLKWKFMPGHQVYGRVAAGFRPADFEPRTEVPSQYEAEDIISYEVGYKGQATLWGGTIQFDAAAYYNDHSDYQQTTLESNEFTGQLIARVENVGDAWSTGFEVGSRGSWQVWGGRLQGQAYFSTSYGEIEEGTPAVTEPMAVVSTIPGDTPRSFPSTKGNRIPGTKDYQVTLSGGYLAPLPNTDLTWFTNLAFTAQGGGYQDPRNQFEDENFEDFTGSLGVRGEGWRAQLFARNIFNEIYELQRTEGRGNEMMATARWIAYSQPRTWGAEVTINW